MFKARQIQAAEAQFYKPKAVIHYLSLAIGISQSLT
jgi:hypothetical protein